MTEKNFSPEQICRHLKLRRQVLEILEREGIIVPRKKNGGIFYRAEQVEEIIFAVSLKREMGVNWAGVEVAIEMRRNMLSIGKQMEEVFDYMRQRLMETMEEND